MTVIARTLSDAQADAEEWQMRCDMAAVFRVAARLGWNEQIGNHNSLMLPGERPLFLISGMINTKDQTGYFRAFKGIARHVFTVPISSSEAGVPNTELALRAEEAGLSAEPVNSVANALMLLRDTWDDRETPPRILIGGSLYFAGEVLSENGTPPT